MLVPESEALQQSSTISQDERPLPFVLRVAAEWIGIDEALDVDDGALFFRDRVRLTGALLSTEGGADVQFSDIGVHR